MERAMIGEGGLPLIRGAEEKVSSFLGVEIGKLSYLFILLGWQTRYLTEVREQLLHHLDAFGEDLGEGGKVVHAYEASKHQTFREVCEKRWPKEVLRLLDETLEPVMLVIDKSFADFDPEVDNWGIIWFSTLESKPQSIPKVLHKLATLSRDGQDIFSYLNALRRRDRLAGVIKYLKIDKVGAFGIFVDVEAIVADVVGRAP